MSITEVSSHELDAGTYSYETDFMDGDFHCLITIFPDGPSSGHCLKPKVSDLSLTDVST